MITIREAHIDDNYALLQLTAITPMNSPFVLRIDRKPNFFNLINERGSGKVFVALKEDKIIGTASISVYDGYWSNTLHQISYLADFKIDPNYQGKIVLWLLIRAIKAFVLKSNCNIIYFVVAAGNTKVEKMLKPRQNLPQFFPVTNFNIYQLFPRIIKPLTPSSFTVVDLKKPKITELNLDRFFNAFNKEYNLAPVVTIDHLNETRVITAYRGDELLSAISLKDMNYCKQNVVLSIPFIHRVLLTLIGVLRLFVPSYPLPVLGETLRILYVKSYAFTPGNKYALKILLKWARWESFKQGFHYLCFGIDEKDKKLYSLLKFMPKICFKSTAYCFGVSGESGFSPNDLNSSLFRQDISTI